MQQRIRRVAIAGAGVAALLAAGAPAADRALSGRVTADGSSTVGPFVIAGAEGFQKRNRGVQIPVGISGTGGGFERFCKGETNLSNASRAINQTREVPICTQNGVRYMAFTVANDGVAVVANRSATWLSCLTTEELKRIWDTGSNITTGRTSARSSRTCR